MNAVVQHLDFEPYNHNCSDCGEVILEPICSKCLIKEIIAISKGTKKLIKKIPEYEEIGEMCIECGRRTVSLCRTCFSENILNKAKSNKKLTGELRLML